MNKTHKITTVAMMIAITGALMLLDRQFGFIMADIYPIFICAVIYFIYDRYDKNMTFAYGFSMILMSFILGNIISWIYTISSVMGALIVCNLLNNTKRIQYSILIFFAVEFIISCLIYPLLGLEVVSGAVLIRQMIKGVNISLFNILTVLGFNFSLLFISVLETYISFTLFNVLRTRVK